MGDSLAPSLDPSDSGHDSSRNVHRYTSFDTGLYALTSSSPAQMKRVLEAHLAETNNRLQEASKLGTDLIEQQQKISRKLDELGNEDDSGEINEELRAKLADLEREYHNLGRDTARAVLASKARISSGEDNVSVPSPSSNGGDSGTTTPNKRAAAAARRPRNSQTPNRIHDIEFATEISTSLLAQVRQLQRDLTEREEALKAANLERAHFERETESYEHRARILDENEQHYKDENWALETKNQELFATIRHLTERESRLTSSLNSMHTGHSSLEKELDDMRHAHARLMEENAAARNAQDLELHSFRRAVATNESKRDELEKKLAEVDGQNQELVKAISAIAKEKEISAANAPVQETYESESESSMSEGSRPPSPQPRPMTRDYKLETDTLRNSLSHAHRKIQSLKNIIHREQTEKHELKRVLHEVRDDMDQRHKEHPTPAAAGRRGKSKSISFKKPPRIELLGAGRRRNTQIEQEPEPAEESEWEDHQDTKRKSTPLVAGGESGGDDHAGTDAGNRHGNRQQLAIPEHQEHSVVESESFPPLENTQSHNSVLSINSGSAASEEGANYSLHQGLSSRHPQRRRHRPSQFSFDDLRISTGLANSLEDESPSTTSFHYPDFGNGQSLFAELGDADGADGAEGEEGAERTLPSVPNSPMPFRNRSFSGLGRRFSLASRPPVSMADASTMTEDDGDPDPFSHLPNRMLSKEATFFTARDDASTSGSIHSRMSYDTIRARDPSAVSDRTDSSFRSVSPVLHPSAAVSYLTSGVTDVETSPTPSSLQPYASASTSTSNGDEDDDILRKDGTIPVLPAYSASKIFDLHASASPAKPSVHLSSAFSDVATPSVQLTRPEQNRSLAYTPSIITTTHTCPSPIPEVTTPDIAVHLQNSLLASVDTLPYVTPPAHLSTSSLQSSDTPSLPIPAPPKADIRFVASAIGDTHTSPVQTRVPSLNVSCPVALEMLSTSPQPKAEDALKPQRPFEASEVAFAETLPSVADRDFAGSLETHTTPLSYASFTDISTAPSSSTKPAPVLSHGESTLHSVHTSPQSPSHAPYAESSALRKPSIATTGTPSKSALVVPDEPRAVPSDDILADRAKHQITVAQYMETIPQSPAGDARPLNPLVVSAAAASVDTPSARDEASELPDTAAPTSPATPKGHRPSSSSSSTRLRGSRSFGSIPLVYYPAPAAPDASSTPVAAYPRPTSRDMCRPWSRDMSTRPPSRDMSQPSTPIALRQPSKPTRPPSEAVVSSSTNDGVTNMASSPVVLRETPAVALDNAGQSMRNAAAVSSGRQDLQSSDYNPTSSTATTNLTPKSDKPSVQDASAMPTPPTRRVSSEVPVSTPTSGRNDPRPPVYVSTSTQSPQTDKLSPRQSPNARQLRSGQRQEASMLSEIPQAEPNTTNGRQPPSHSNSPGADENAAGTARIYKTRPSEQSERPISLRSSVSSFTSEIDQRFNPQDNATGLSKDPAMIGAITETMIGEFMWKYTRRPMHRSEISSSRHRRYVWVHPYTRTIYWSTREPQSGGSNNWVKSLPIEDIRVIEDTNPYPPGLSQQSLDIVTPSRTMRFTAATTQRHDVWYNAITYLLVKTASGSSGEGAGADDSFHLDSARDDFLDLPPSNTGSSTHRSSRVSSQSNTPRRRQSPGQSSSHRLYPTTGNNSRRMLPTSNPHGSLSPLSAASSRTSRPRSISRLGGFLSHGSSAQSFFRRRRGKLADMNSGANGGNDSNTAANNSNSTSNNGHQNDSHMSPSKKNSDEQQQQHTTAIGGSFSTPHAAPVGVAGVENVRACCGGKHDVGSLCRPPPGSH